MQNNAYLFILACLNYSESDYARVLGRRGGGGVSSKMGEMFKQIKVAVEGPIWYEILNVANKKLSQL